nr:hypothetical protein [Tanacetum cinerariifolium]
MCYDSDFLRKISCSSGTCKLICNVNDDLSTLSAYGGRITLTLFPNEHRFYFGIRTVGNKMHKAFPLPGESSHWQYKFSLPVKGVPTARRMEIPLLAVCTAMMKKLPVKDRWQLH